MRRYSSRPGVSFSDGSASIRRTQAILILLLAVALAVSLILLLPSANYRRETEHYYVNRMLTECDDAVQQAKKLSRTASTSSYEILAQIRSEIYAIELMNQANQAAGGPLMLPQNVFDGFYQLFDNYFNRLNVGSQTGELQTQLTADLDSLHLLIEALQ
ncbi:MAG: hypothetical protein IKH38_06265 [Clostridia bacterium]|nr:hypothetical protein [Clostridia bacterium]